MDVGVKDFMTFLKKGKENKFIVAAFRELVASQIGNNEADHIEKAIYNLEIALDKQRKDTFYAAMIKN